MLTPRACGLSTEWRLADRGFRHIVEVVAEHGQAADRIIAIQDNQDWLVEGFRDVAGLLAVEAARLRCQGASLGSGRRYR